MARHTISLPDDLSEELKKLGDRINISWTCQQALRTEVARLNFMPGDGPDIADEVVERLRKEKEDWATTWYQAGKDLATQVAPRLHYPDLIQWVSRSEEIANSRQRELEWRLQRIPDPFNFVLEKEFDHEWGLQNEEEALERARISQVVPAAKKFVYNDYGNYGVHNYDSVAVKRGWMDGIRTFWEKLKKKI